MIPTIIMVRISLKLSFYNEVSFKEAVGSLCFNHSPTYPNTLQQIESSMLPQDTERNEDIWFNNPPKWSKYYTSSSGK